MFFLCFLVTHKLNLSNLHYIVFPSHNCGLKKNDYILTLKCDSLQKKKESDKNRNETKNEKRYTVGQVFGEPSSPNVLYKKQKKNIWIIIKMVIK